MSGVEQGGDLQFLAGQLATGVKLLREALARLEAEVSNLHLDTRTAQHKREELFAQAEEVQRILTQCTKRVQKNSQELDRLRFSVEATEKTLTTYLSDRKFEEREGRRWERVKSLVPYVLAGAGGAGGVAGITELINALRSVGN